MDDPTFDDLIPGLQVGAPQDGELTFEDLIPNQGASWPPVSGAPPMTQAQLAASSGSTSAQRTAAAVGMPSYLARPTEMDDLSDAAALRQGSTYGAYDPIADAFGVPGRLPQGFHPLEASLEPQFEALASGTASGPNFTPVPGSGLANALSQYQSLLGLQSPLPEAEGSSYQVNWPYIGQHEAAGGVPVLSLYVPTNKDGTVVDSSGVTVGLGVDLHGRTKASLIALGVDPALAAELAAYAPYQGADALSYVHQHPLDLTRAQVDHLDAAVQHHDLSSLAENFDAASSVGKFANLPPNTQTAIADLYFQYGVTNPAGAAPNFWNQVTAGDWRGAYNNLMDFGDKYRTRRHSEAALLLKDISAGKLARQISP